MRSVVACVDRLRWPSLRLRIMCMVGSVALVAAILTFGLVVIAVRMALGDGIDAQVQHRVLATLDWMLAVVVIGVGLASAGAAAYLTASIGGAVSRLQHATAAIADGCFEHRVETTRRDEFGMLAGSIDAMAERLSELESARHRLLASVSHELRTPLTVIRGHAFTLSRSEDDPARRDRYALIDDEAERLASLIGDLLSAATMRVTPLSLDVERVDAVGAIERALDRVRGQASAKRVEMVMRAPVTHLSCIADRKRLGQILDNLLANAVAHAPEGSTMRARVSWTAAGIRFSIANAGQTIEPTLLGTIFEPFTQGQRPTGSVGLGLSIARSLVRAQHGELRVRSRDDMTEFWFVLPAQPEPQRAPGRSVPLRPALAR